MTTKKPSAGALKAAAMLEISEAIGTTTTAHKARIIDEETGMPDLLEIAEAAKEVARRFYIPGTTYGDRSSKAGTAICNLHDALAKTKGDQS